ncbi:MULTISPECIES: heavy-metal-associated domain-containing protein [Actinomycetes]|uniref:Copper chaperone CopZ n=2 Tax=Quadrisphaera TaxID=317661 RepID=A0A316A4Z6_9ACTN|nr:MULTISPECIES: heavy metal-associated domain-containing protein [Actinomycetes]PWJ52542.1 copper chaperone CopZ [Quadrisphaera granulorum]TNM60456.1 heavy-metal-associated domain-containing protein [Streptomyces sp. NP160]TXR52403.1 heavy-metal-associated domain-containing protein [Quadrisphaera setariae]SZE97592.1 Copper chaperone CopZ [Quadrisphaera granulorum]
MDKRYQVSGMTCGHCETSVREEVSVLAGVREVEVDASTGVLVVKATQDVPTSQVLAAVEEAGYTAVPVP